MPGVFAAGEAADPHFRQVVTSAGMGAAAAIQATRFLEAESGSNSGTDTRRLSSQIAGGSLLFLTASEMYSCSEIHPGIKYAINIRPIGGKHEENLDHRRRHDRLPPRPTGWLNVNWPTSCWWMWSRACRRARGSICWKPCRSSARTWRSSARTITPPPKARTSSSSPPACRASRA